MAVRFAAQLLIGHGRHFDMKIDAVEQRTAYFRKIALNDAGGTAAFASAVSIKALCWCELDGISDENYPFADEKITLLLRSNRTVAI